MEMVGQKGKRARGKHRENEKEGQKERKKKRIKRCEKKKKVTDGEIGRWTS